ncbi:MAG: hypothetical protein AB3X44_01680 [Leptothrix sp. (in: b-proteobacteria)]
MRPTVSRSLAALAARDLARLPATRQIVAGMATVAGNETALGVALGSLLPQVDRIDLYLNGYTEVPELLQAYPQIRCQLDPEGRRYGDAGKFWGLQDCTDTLYLSCDDDIAYPHDYVARMVQALAQHEGRCAVGVHAALLRQAADTVPRSYYAAESRSVWHFETALLRERRAHVLGTGTTAFHTHHVRPPLSDFAHPNMADLWLAKYLHERHLPAFAVARSARWLQQLPVQRPTIFEHSARRHTGRFDTSRQQDQLAAALRPLSVLRGNAPEVPVYVVEVQTRRDLPELLAALARSADDAVLLLIDALAPSAGPPLTLQELPDTFCELHLLGPDAPSAWRPSYTQLLASAPQQVRCLRLYHTGQQAELIDLGPQAWVALFGRNATDRKQSVHSTHPSAALVAS